MEELDETGIPPEDRRQYERSRLTVDVFFDGKDATGMASTSDISIGGLYMQTKDDLPEGAVLMLRIPLGEDRQVLVNGEVIYSNPGRGVGIRFQGLSEADRAALESEMGKN